MTDDPTTTDLHPADVFTPAAEAELCRRRGAARRPHADGLADHTPRPDDPGTRPDGASAGTRPDGARTRPDGAGRWPDGHGRAARRPAR